MWNILLFMLRLPKKIQQLFHADGTFAGMTRFAVNANSRLLQNIQNNIQLKRNPFQIRTSFGALLYGVVHVGIGSHSVVIVLF